MYFVCFFFIRTKKFHFCDTFCVTSFFSRCGVCVKLWVLHLKNVDKCDQRWFCPPQEWGSWQTMGRVSISIYIYVPSIQLLPLTMTTLALWHCGNATHSSIHTTKNSIVFSSVVKATSNVFFFSLSLPLSFGECVSMCLSMI